MNRALWNGYEQTLVPTTSPRNTASCHASWKTQWRIWAMACSCESEGIDSPGDDKRPWCSERHLSGMGIFSKLNDWCWASWIVLLVLNVGNGGNDPIHNYVHNRPSKLHSPFPVFSTVDFCGKMFSNINRTFCRPTPVIRPLTTTPHFFCMSTMLIFLLGMFHLDDLRYIRLYI